MGAGGHSGLPPQSSGAAGRRGRIGRPHERGRRSDACLPAYLPTGQLSSQIRQYLTPY
jgi:hypothetical protein